MSTYPVDIKSTTASTVAVHNAVGTGAPGRALGLYVSKEGGQAATTVKIKDNTTVLEQLKSQLGLPWHYMPNKSRLIKLRNV